MEGDTFQLAKLAIIPETTNLFGKNFQKQMLLIKRKLDQTVVATSLNLKQEHSMLANGHKPNSQKTLCDRGWWHERKKIESIKCYQNIMQSL